LTGKTASERKNIPSVNGNKVMPTPTEHSITDNEDGKHTTLVNYKAAEATLTSTTMLTQLDVTADEGTSKQGKALQ